MRKWIKLVAVALVAVVSQGETMSSPVPRNPRPPGGSQNLWGLTLFCWGLTTYPEDNILLQFETDLERTLEIYNRAVQHADDGVAGISHSNTSQPVLAGYAQLTPAQAHELERQIGFIGPPTITFEMLQKLMEGVLGLTLEELGAIFLRLAQAEREGRYDQEYEALAHAGLAGLRKVLFESPADFPAYPSVVRVMMLPKEALEARAKEFIKAAALECRRIVTEQLAPRQLEPQKLPAVLLVAGVRWLARIVINVVADFVLKEHVLQLLFAQDPIQPVLVLPALDRIEVYVITLFTLDNFNAALNVYHERYPAFTPSVYYWRAWTLVNDPVPEDKNVHLSMLSALLHFVARVYERSPEFFERMRLVTQTVSYMRRLQVQKYQSFYPQWRPQGIFVSEEHEATLVLGRDREFSGTKVSCHAAIRISLDAQIQRSPEHYQGWFREAVGILSGADAEAHERSETPRWLRMRGNQVAAVVFKERMDPRSVRELADAVYSSGVLLGEAAVGYIIWHESTREGDKVFFSRVKVRGLGELPEEDIAVVRGLVPAWDHLPIGEYLPQRRSNTSPQSSNTLRSPLVLAGGAEWSTTTSLKSCHLMWGIDRP